jgi:acetyl esterase
VRIYDPGTTAPAPSVVLLHGGGWMFGTIDSYDGFARQIAKRSGLRCLSVEYALAPEHPFPAALEDCIAAVRWAASEEGASLGIDCQRIADRGFGRRQSRARSVPYGSRCRGEPGARGSARIRLLFT